MNKHQIMIVDTELEGHHVLWLCLTAQVMLAGGCPVTMVVNQNLNAVVNRIRQIDATLPDKLKIIASPISKKTSVRDYFKEICRIFRGSNADKILFNNFDTIASKLFRLAALGYIPPRELWGKVAIIYHRPRPLDAGQRGFSVYWKRLGINKLIKSRFFSQIFLLDPLIVKQVFEKFSGMVDVNCIPDPWVADDSPAKMPPEFDFGDGNCKLLQYGVGDKRKGTELLLRALAGIENNLDVTLIIAGKQKDPVVREMVNNSRHRVVLIDRFISNAEEKFLFEACDVVAIPYLSHYGSSNILSKAAQYQKPVLASDFHLIGRLVMENNLGVVFQNQNSRDLANKLRSLTSQKCQEYHHSLRVYSQRCSFGMFTRVLQGML